MLKTVVDWCVKNATAVVDGWLVQHKDDGTHTNITATSVTAARVAATEAFAFGRNAVGTEPLLTIAVNDDGPSPVVDVIAAGAGNTIHVYAESGISLQVPVSDANAAAIFVGAAGININSGTGDLELIKGQLNFPAIQNPSTDAHTLDDYEEGTWTPTWTFGGGSTGITYSANTGAYVKVGRHIYLSFRTIFTNKGSSVGQAILGGVPSFNLTDVQGCSGFYNGMAGVSSGLVFFAASANSIAIATPTSTVAAVLSDGNFTNTSDVYGFVTGMSAS
jgi:hypothetical protein